MTGTWFVDTTVLIYEIDARDSAKQRRAAEWMRAVWSARSGRTSVQVLNEFYYTATSKLEPGLSAADAWAEVGRLQAWRPSPLTTRILAAAYLLQDRYALNWWDCLVVASAQHLACGYLLTEDLQDGQTLDGVQVVNPFLHQPADFA